MKKVITSLALIGLASSFEDSELIARPLRPLLQKPEILHVDETFLSDARGGRKIIRFQDHEHFAADAMEDMGNLELFDIKKALGLKKKKPTQPQQPQQPQYSNSGYQIPINEQSYDYELYGVDNSNDHELFDTRKYALRHQQQAMLARGADYYYA